jgi:hypothetical protein
VKMTIVETSSFFVTAHLLKRIIDTTGDSDLLL